MVSAARLHYCLDIEETRYFGKEHSPLTADFWGSTGVAFGHGAGGDREGPSIEQRAAAGELGQASAHHGWLETPKMSAALAAK